MPLKKLISVERGSKRRTLPPGNPTNIRHLFQLVELSYLLRPWRFPPGLKKFGSIEEADIFKKSRDTESIRMEAKVG